MSSAANSSPTISDAQDEMQLGLVLPKAGTCFHCGEPLPKVPFVAHVLGQNRQMCCLGCQLAAQSIVEAGLSQYYLDRQKISRLASVPDELQLEVYNHSEIKEKFIYQEGDAVVAELSVVGLRCAACTWLIESRLSKLEGVGRCQVNLTQQRMRVLWDENKTNISEILKSISSIGYEAHPYRQDTHEAMMKRQNKKMLIRLGVAAIGTMQAMMFAIGTYFGAYSGMASEHRQFLQYVSMVASIPVIFYAGVPFFSSAWSALRAKTINMDVPVSIALIVTFVASSVALFSQQGETYFDSVAMFIFFLLAGRYVEQSARLKAASMASDLVVIAPKLVKKITNDGELLSAYRQDSDNFLMMSDKYLNHYDSSQAQMVHKVVAGDVVWVGAGDEILGDGVLLSTHANVSQSLLTGESSLIEKTQGDKLYGGSQNDSQPLLMLVTENGENSQLALIDRLINRAMSEKPAIAEQADKLAKVFVARILILSLIVFVVWWFIEPSRAIWATVAVLVATCPCALSLATPIALTVATNRLAQSGFLVTRGHTITALSKIEVAAFDKTGTLTKGQATLIHTAFYNDNIFQAVFGTSDKNALFALAGAMEAGSRHPIAECLKRHSQSLHLPTLESLTHHSGGVAAICKEHAYRLGTLDFVLDQNLSVHSTHPDAGRVDYDAYQANMAAALSIKQEDGYRLLALFYFNDGLRQDSQAVIATLKDEGIAPIMLTGDPSATVKTLAQTLDIDYHQGLLPEQKVAHIQSLQAQNKTVLMVGDGINDAPVLAAADVSLAMANASDLAQVAADGVILGEGLSPVLIGRKVALKTHRIIRQNLRWAFVYNTLVILPAALGYVPPWLAAIGMSLSSLFVVLNALRIRSVD